MTEGFCVVGGGARSGKSRFALELALRHGEPRLFVATAEPLDDEMRKRARAHREERGAAFETIESPRDLDRVVASLCDAPRARVVIVDCLTLWISNLLLAGASPADIERRTERVALSLSRAPFAGIVVTNEVGMGVVPGTPLGRLFRDTSGRAHQRLATQASSIYFAALGTMLRLKPSPVELVAPEIAP